MKTIKDLNNSFSSVRGNRFKCWYCGNEERCTKDHFYPKSKGGTVTVYACLICQYSKKDLHPLDWLDYIKSHVAISNESKIIIEKAVLTLHNFIQTKSINFGKIDTRKIIKTKQ